MKAKLVLAFIILATIASGEELTIPHIKVEYSGIEATQARALAETLAAAREVYVSDFGFDMPDTVRLNVTVDPQVSTQLFNDAVDMLFLKLKSKDDLRRPSVSGIFNLYGMCHELGHVAMYRLLKQREWLTDDAAEGWAHYAGSRLVDRVYALKGGSLWPDPYDYRADGTPRLINGLAAANPSGVDRAAGEWLLLEEILGQRAFANVFTLWNSATVDPAKPAGGLLAALVKSYAGKDAALTAWWASAAPQFTKRKLVSAFSPAAIAAERLTGTSVLLPLDAGVKDGQMSFGGAAVWRSFKTPDSGEWYIRAVSAFGERYGDAPDLKFAVVLADGDWGVIQTWEHSYAPFDDSKFKWVRVEIPPTRVPAAFKVGIDFNASGSDGIYVGYNSSTKGASASGAPGAVGEPYFKGDWMIQVELDRAK
jgi:hypothetical protein